MTNEERNRAQDILDNLLRDEYMRGFQDCLVSSFSKSESESIIRKLEKQNELMLSILKDIDTQIKVGYEVYNILTPEIISDISSIISKVEGEKE
jgi:hypothetical protein